MGVIEIMSTNNNTPESKFANENAAKTASPVNVLAKPATPAATATPAKPTTVTPLASKPQTTASATPAAKPAAPKAVSKPVAKPTAKPAAKKPATSTKPATKPAAKSTAKTTAKPSQNKTASTAKKAGTSSKVTANSASKAAKKTAQTKPAAKATSTSSTSKVYAMSNTAKKSSSKSAFGGFKSTDHVLSFGKDGAAQFAKTTDAATRAFNESVAQGKEGIEAFIASSNVTADMARNFLSESFRFANESFSDNVEISKDLFNCRTINDMFDIQNRMMRSNMDHFFNQSVKVSEMFFQFVSEATEPLNETAAKAGDRFNKASRY